MTREQLERLAEKINGKTCRKCKRTLSACMYSKLKCAKDGLQYVCKECFAAWYARNRSVIRQRQRELWRAKVDSDQEYNKKHWQKRKTKGYVPSREKALARRKLRYAIDKGRLVKPSSCSQCGMRGRIHGHHSDYSKPLEVEWLCARCHGERHRVC